MNCSHWSCSLWRQDDVFSHSRADLQRSGANLLWRLPLGIIHTTFPPNGILMVAGTPILDLLIRCFAVVSFLVPRDNHSCVRYPPREQHMFVVNDCVRFVLHEHHPCSNSRLLLPSNTPLLRSTVCLLSVSSPKLYRFATYYSQPSAKPSRLVRHHS